MALPAPRQGPSPRRQDLECHNARCAACRATTRVALYGLPNGKHSSRQCLAWFHKLEKSNSHDDDRCSHVGVDITMIGKCTSSRKRKMKGSTIGNVPAIERLPIVAGDRMGCR